MAKLSSIIKIEGTLDELTFYKTSEGHYVKRKGGISKSRIQNDPNFARTRENGIEFGHAATSSKQLRRAVQALITDAKDNRVSSRLTSIMTKIKNLDTTSLRGQRQVSLGITSSEGKEALKGFNFNNKAILSSVLLTDYSLDTVTGEITIIDFNPAQNLAAPQGATHVSFTSGFLNLDFATNEKNLQLSPEVNLGISSSLSDLNLLPTQVPIGSGSQFYFLKIAFFQEINEIQYPLNNGAFNALQLIEVI